MTRHACEVSDAQGTTNGRGRAQESAPRQRRASAVDGRGVQGRWGVGPDGEGAPCGRVRAVWRRCPVPVFAVVAGVGDHNAPKGRAVAPYDNIYVFIQRVMEV